MTDVLPPVSLIRNISAWMKQVQDNMKNRPGFSIFDVYVAIENARLELERYLEIQDNVIPQEIEGQIQSRIEDFSESESVGE